MADERQEPGQKGLFKEVSFFLADDKNEEVKTQLLTGGATREFYVNELVTHVIASSTQFPEYPDAKEYNLKLVTPRWVTMSSSLDQLLPHEPFCPDTDQLLSGVVVCPSQIPPEDRNALWAMVTFYGGKCQLNLNPKCTHLVVPKASGEKYECAMKHQDTIKIVTPGWITDSIKHNMKMKEEDYQPCEEGHVDTDSILTPDSAGQTTSLTSVLTSNSGITLATSAQSPRPALTLSSTVMSPISPVVTTAASMKSLVTMATGGMSDAGPKSGGISDKDRDAVTKSSGIPEDNNKDVVKERSADECVMLEHKEPVAAKGSMVKETPSKLDQAEQAGAEGQGGKESGGMLENDKENNKQKATVAMSVKDQETNQEDEKAPSQCLAGCVFIISDYQECLEHAVLDTWIQVIEQHGGTVIPFYAARCTHLLCLHQRGALFQKALADGKRIVSAHWLNDVLTEEKLCPPTNPLHLPVPFKAKLDECKEMLISVTGYTGAQRLLLKNMIFILGAKYTGHLSRANTHLICKSAIGEKYNKAGEWNIVRVNAAWLGDTLTAGRPMSCSLVKYTAFGGSADLDICADLVKDLLAPWQADLDRLKQQAGTSRKRCLEERSSPENSQAKKSRKSSRSESEERREAPRVLFTGLPSADVARLAKVVTDLGGTVVAKARQCTHLVCCKILRTVKFLSAISVCHHVVRTDWLKESYKQNSFLDPKSFPVTEVTNIIQMNQIDIGKALERAREKPLLEGKQIYVTQNVVPSSAAMREIVECAGGKVLPSVPSPHSLAALNAEEKKQGSPILIVISCDKDLQLCDEFTRRGFTIYNAELLLAGVLEQRLDFSLHILKRPPGQPITIK